MQNKYHKQFFLDHYKNCKSFRLQPEMVKEEYDLVIGSIDLPLTTRCNLRCKHCGSLMDYYRQPADVDCETIIASLDRLLAASDCIVRANVLGGEPFLYPHLEKILEYLQAHEKIIRVYIPTNGLYLPKRPGLFDALRGSKIRVRISRYNAYNHKIEDTLKTLATEKIEHSVKEFGLDNFLWYDFGEFELRDRSNEALIQQYKQCDVEWYSVFKGKLFPCPRAAHATDLGLIEADGNYVDLLDASDSIESLKKKLQNFIFERQYYPCCKYCDRGSGHCPQIRVAEQV